MKDDFSNSNRQVGLSLKWDVALPLGIALVPMCCFALMGFLFRVLINPQAPLPSWFAGVVVVLNTTGIVAMAIVALMRCERGVHDLNVLFPNGPPAWRKSCLLLSVICATIFEVLTNLATAFAGAGVFFRAAAVFYGLYLLLVRLAFRKRVDLAEPMASNPNAIWEHES